MGRSVVAQRMSGRPLWRRGLRRDASGDETTPRGDSHVGRSDLAASPEQARSLYEHFVEKLRVREVPVETGIFQASMAVHLVNDGPVTLVCESPPK